MKDYAIIMQIVSLLITFATILSHYWVIKMKLSETDFRVRALETKRENFDELSQKIMRIEILLEHLEKILNNGKSNFNSGD